MESEVKRGALTVTFDATALSFERHLGERCIQPPFAEHFPTGRWTTIFDVVERGEVERALDELSQHIDGKPCKFRVTITAESD